MFKKTTLGILAVLLVGGFLFGNKGITYLTTAAQQARQAAQDSVPVSFQIEAAKTQLAKIQPEIKDMVWQIAKEKSQIKRLNTELVSQQNTMKSRYNEMMALRNHLETGDDYYVALDGKAYANTRVEEDLTNRFSVYKTAKQTMEKSQQILDLRTKAMDSAFVKLEQAKALQRELQVNIENLNARQRMVEVAKTASNINIDDSQLAKTQSMIDDIGARLDAEEEMMNLSPQLLGEIPVSKEALTSDGNILEEMAVYFGDADSEDASDVVQK